MVFLKVASFIQIVLAGGVWMLPFFGLTVWWLVLLVRACRQPASLSKGVVFLLFPGGYGLVALAKIVEFQQREFSILAASGSLGDASQYAEMGFHFTHSTWVVIAFGLVSFLVAAGFVWRGCQVETWRSKARTE